MLSATSAMPWTTVKRGHVYNGAEEEESIIAGPSSGMALARAVTIGGRTETLVEILSGVVAGETVVTTGAYGVQDSARIGGARQ